MTLKCFFSRRVKSSKQQSDNAANMVSTKSEHKKLSKLVFAPNDKFLSYLISENTEWNFIPPKSPHFGDLWEAGSEECKASFSKNCQEDDIKL